MAPIAILHLIGSPTSDAYRELSELYARQCVAAVEDRDKYRFVFAHVSPGDIWRFPASLAFPDIAAAPCVDFVSAVSKIAEDKVDLALPQMFCERGVTEYRALLSLLSIPYLGNPPEKMAIAANKSVAKAIVASAGVRVPRSKLCRSNEMPDMAPPVVVKPNSADNSDGVTLVRSVAEYPSALSAALEHSDAALVEEYIELGREVRCGVVERDGDIICLPLEEYFVDPISQPIRGRGDKLRRDDHGTLFLAAKTRRESWMVENNDPIVPAVREAALRAHRAIGFRQYSLFDFRIDSDGAPWFLEAGPYCSFAPDSVIVTMMAAAGVPLVDYFQSAVADCLDGSMRKTALA